MVLSLLGFAVLINSLCVSNISCSETNAHVVCTRILIVAAAVFYNGTATAVPASLFDAHDLIRDIVGRRTCHGASFQCYI
jgi:metal iron transporter